MDRENKIEPSSYCSLGDATSDIRPTRVRFINIKSLISNYTTKDIYKI